MGIPQMLGATAIALVLLTLSSHSESTCTVPKQYQGDFFSLEQGVEVNTIIDNTVLHNEVFEGNCVEIFNSTITRERNIDSLIMFEDSGSGCFVCWKMMYRTPNVLQYQKSSCYSSGGNQPTLEFVCSDIQPKSELFTFFRKSPLPADCKDTFEGVSHFAYEVAFWGGGICDSPSNIINACQEHGSPYINNEVFRMDFGKCPEVSTSVNERTTMQCMGRWHDESGNIWMAVADIARDRYRERYKCMLTRENQKSEGNYYKHLAMSRFADCSSLRSPYEGDIRLMIDSVSECSK